MINNQGVIGNVKIIFLKAFYAPENMSAVRPNHKAESIERHWALLSLGPSDPEDARFPPLKLSLIPEWDPWGWESKMPPNTCYVMVFSSVQLTVMVKINFSFVAVIVVWRSWDGSYVLPHSLVGKKKN